MSIQNCTLEVGDNFFVNLIYFDYVKKNPTKFPSRKVDVVEGVFVGINQKCGILKFEAMVEVQQVPLKKMEKITFFKNKPPNCDLFTSRSFLATDSEEFLNRSSNCLNFVATMKSQGAILDAPTENLDLYAESCPQTRVKRLKHCLLKILEQPASNTLLEKKRLEVQSLIGLSTPLWDPCSSFMELWMLIGKKLYMSMGHFRGSEEGTIELSTSRVLVEKIMVPYLQIAAWTENPCNTTGRYEFVSTSVEKVKETFASSELMPGMLDPLNRLFFMKDNKVFEQMKEVKGIYLKVPCNPNDAKIKKKELYKMAVNELGANAVGRQQQNSKCALGRKIINHRIAQKSFLGFKELRKVSISVSNPFKLEIKPGAFGTSVVRCSFHVSAFTFKVSKQSVSCRRSTMG